MDRGGEPVRRLGFWSDVQKAAVLRDGAQCVEGPNPVHLADRLPSLLFAGCSVAGRFASDPGAMSRAAEEELRR